LTLVEKKEIEGIFSSGKMKGKKKHSWITARGLSKQGSSASIAKKKKGIEE